MNDAISSPAGSCDCSGVDARKPTRPLGAIEIQIVPGTLPDKARIALGSGTMQVGADWWDTLDELQKVAVVAHEFAHEENPKESCEECIDARAGAILRHFGYSRTAVEHGLAGIVDSRDAAAAAVMGWNKADEAIAEGTDIRYLDEAGNVDDRPFMRIRRLEGPDFSAGAADVDGTSFADPSQIDQLLAGGKPPPKSSAPRTPTKGAAPTTPQTRAPALSSTATAIVAALAVAVLAGLVVHALVSKKG